MVSKPVRFRAFLGRTTELEHLLERRSSAAKGRGGIVLVAGDAGIGKSRLVHEFVTNVPRRTTRVIRTAYREFAQRPLAPLLELIEQLGPSRPIDPERLGSKAELTAELAHRFERIALAQTTIVVVEDVHWAGRELFEVLLALCDGIERSRLMIVATYRDAEITSEHPNFTTLGKLLRSRAVSLVSLEPLATSVIDRLVRGTVDRELVPANVLESVRTRADGNAFFAEELLRFALDNDASNGRARTMPISIAAVIRERIALASPESRALLDVAALFGRNFDATIVGNVLARGDVAAANETTAELVRLGLIEPARDERSSFRFRHALTRDAVYGEIDPDEARALHERVGQMLAALPDADRHVESLAHHFWHARDLERAAPYCTAAAEAARSVFAYDEASELFERAARCEADPLRAARALFAGAQTAKYADRIERAIALYERAAREFERAEAFDDVAIASTLRAAALFEDGRPREATDYLEAMHDRIASRASSPVRERLLLRLGFFFAFTRRIEDAWGCVRSLDDRDDEASLPLAAERYVLASGLYAYDARVPEWRRSFDRAYGLLERIGGHPDNRRVALSNAALQGVAVGEVSAAREFQARALAIARENRTYADHEHVLLAHIELQAGDVAFAREALATTREEERFASRVERAILRAWLAQLFGDDDGAVAAALAAMPNGDGIACARVGAAVAPLLDRGTGERQANALYERAADAIDTVAGTTFAIAAIAAARPNLAMRLRPLVARAAERPGDRVNRALLSFVDASVARRAGGALGRAAARGFGEIGWPWLAAQAMELAGDRGAALSFYRTIDARAQIRRLETATRDGIPASGSVLTARERDVVRIVASGAGNREAAAYLSISDKAVEKHLTSIYAKLGVTSRAQLAIVLGQNSNV